MLHTDTGTPRRPSRAITRRPFITTGEAAARAHVSTSTIRVWIETGALPGIRVVGRMRIDPADLDALLKGTANFGRDPTR